MILYLELSDIIDLEDRSMKNFKKVIKVMTALALAAAVCLAPAKTVKADAATDALIAQQQLMIEQQLQLIQAYQAALIAQYQQQLADQYSKALLVMNEAQANQLRAIQQSYMLNAVQAQQKAMYQCMLESTGVEYQGRLLNAFKVYQQQALDAFKGYEGLKK